MILATLYFFLPGYIANSIPPILNKFKLFESLAIPVDFNKKFKGKDIFGNHKTIRGVLGTFIIGTLLTVLFFEINKEVLLYEVIGLDYLKWNSFIFGMVYSISIIFGDLLFAFIKRRLNLKPGAPFIPFDQTNYVLGMFILLQPFLKLSLCVWIVIFIQTFILHSVFNRLGYVFHLHNAKW
ncbi:MAG: CDP-archaeol synthase [Candidatus Paceibacterota bacterium]